MIPGARSIVQCGTWQGYRQGCRCDECKAAWAAYYRSRNPQRPMHGSLRKFDMGCECSECVAAWVAGSAV